MFYKILPSNYAVFVRFPGKNNGYTEKDRTIQNPSAWLFRGYVPEPELAAAIARTLKAKACRVRNLRTGETFSIDLSTQTRLL